MTDNPNPTGEGLVAHEDRIEHLAPTSYRKPPMPADPTQARRRSKCRCSCHNGAGMLHIQPCCVPYPTQAPEDGLVERLRQLDAAASPGPWVYRPNEHDDWGWIRGVEKDSDIGRYRPIVANGRNSDVTQEQQAEHRRAKTDPYGPNAELIVALRNEALARITADAAEIGKLRAALERLSALTPERANAYGAYGLHLTVKAIAEAALSPSQGE